MNNRIQYIDRLKGFTMLLVVMGHIYYFTYSHSESIWFKGISSFHMPLFMFLSGMLIYKKNLPYCYSFSQLLKKVLMFILPMIVFGMCFTFFFANVHSYDDIIFEVVAFLFSPAKNGYWYLVSLSIFYISMQLFRFNRSNTFVWDIVLSVFVYCIFLLGWKMTTQVGNLFCLLNCTDFYPFFILGYFTRKYDVVEFVKQNNIIFTIAIIGYLILFNRDWGFHAINTLSERFVIRLCAIIAIVMLFVWRENKFSYIEKKLSYVGRNTLDIYVLHYFIVCNINLVTVDRWLENSNNYVLSIFFTLFIAIPITFISIGIGKILHRSTFVEKYIYGKI